MFAHGIHTGADLARWSLEELQRVFGKAGRYYYHAARAIDERPVVSQRVRKSIGSETTFDHDLADTQIMLQHLAQLAEQVAKSLQTRRLAARTLTVKVRYQNFRLVTRSMSFEQAVHHVEHMRPQLNRLLGRTEAGSQRVRLLGVSVSNLCNQSDADIGVQLDLFEPAPDAANKPRADFQTQDCSGSP
jgi:DNA polymerase-4